MNHRHVCQILGADRESFAGSLICVVLPWMSYGNVLQYIAKVGWSAQDAIRLIFQVASGLAYLHGKNVVHGDLHVGNIPVDAARDVRLADFGLANFSDSSTSCSSAQPGAMRCMAPEILDPTRFRLPRTQHTPASDMYSFGQVSWQIYTGKIPFPDMNNYQAMLAILDGKSQERSLSDRDISDTFWDIIQACWCFDPPQRTGAVTARDRLEAIDSADHADIPPRPTMRDIDRSTGFRLSHELAHTTDTAGFGKTSRHPPPPLAPTILDPHLHDHSLMLSPLSNASASFGSVCPSPTLICANPSMQYSEVIPLSVPAASLAELASGSPKAPQRNHQACASVCEIAGEQARLARQERNKQREKALANSQPVGRTRGPAAGPVLPPPLPAYSANFPPLSPLPLSALETMRPPAPGSSSSGTLPRVHLTIPSTKTHLGQCDSSAHATSSFREVRGLSSLGDRGMASQADNRSLGPQPLRGVSIGFSSPAISSPLAPMEGPEPDVITLPYPRHVPSSSVEASDEDSEEKWRFTDRVRGLLRRGSRHNGLVNDSLSHIITPFYTDGFERDKRRNLPAGDCLSRSVTPPPTHRLRRWSKPSRFGKDNMSHIITPFYINDFGR
ncbi:uncharacterized protein PHACADRAFT_188727 [Phanerochaete carnosa HHB-10118-sp]|uniref:Protein kinase domain-containing protein n=1 Tax=Phanerochaete carnosa (strain HHB-10118-sp) TaxID=650164 RepID=K5VSC3_PHACS|nr:uncharacterized protein PHACADRAFT_188727 [Phanerochaete carnosa HHB-10118-sp]EKM49675.1 hypothetical protein PHACADRAFT_188727 [Phanerochaete carnosa HHB-10118-sp]